MGNYPEGVQRNRLTNMQVVARVLQGDMKEEELTDHQADYYYRIRGVYGLMLAAHPRNTVIEYIQGEFDVSYATARRLYLDTEAIFGAEKANKEIKRQIAENMALTSYRMAEEQGNVKMMIAATKAYTEASGANSPDFDLPDFAKVEPAPIIVVLPKETENALLSMLQGGAVNLNQFKPNAVIDIDHEEIREDKGK